MRMSQLRLIEIVKFIKPWEIKMTASAECLSENSTNSEICRICHCGEGDNIDNSLVSPCYCSGSLRYVHQQCLQQWIKTSDIKCCELCKFQFIMETKLKPFNQWEPLDMTPLERRKLICRVIFHFFASFCVISSLYVLIDRTAEELKHHMLEWPFWTKLVIIFVVLSGGVTFMYTQCTEYVQLLRRWRAYNRVIYIQNAPERPIMPETSLKPHLDLTPTNENPKAISTVVSPECLLHPLPPEDNTVIKPVESITENHYTFLNCDSVDDKEDQMPELSNSCLEKRTDEIFNLV